MNYVKNKRQIIEQRQLPKWDPTSFHGLEFSAYDADQALLAKKSLLPLDTKPLQEKPFLRTGMKGSQFSHTVGSVI